MTLPSEPSGPFHLIFITADPAEARTVALAGVDRVMVDLEILGKEARQGHLDTVISRHHPQDVRAVAEAVRGTGAEVLVRLNPLHEGSGGEIEEALARGADRLMLPMFRTPGEVAGFLGLVAGRVPVNLLLETATALARLPRILEVGGAYDLHLGLNDLHLELGLGFMFEIMSEGLADHAARLCQAAGRPLGIGGVARLGGSGALPAELILGEHKRLGSAGVILSRDWRQSLAAGDFARDLAAFRAGLAHLSPPEGNGPQAAFRAAVAGILSGRV